MKTNLWSMKTGFVVFAVAVVGMVLLDHVRGFESVDTAERTAAADQKSVIRGATPVSAEIAPAENSSFASADSEHAGRRAPSATPASEEIGDLGTAIRQTAAEYTRAFNRGDAGAIAALWTADGEYLDGAGKHLVGRDVIEREYAQFFAEHRGAKIEIKIDAIRPIGTDAAIEDGHARLLPNGSGALPASPYTVIHAKVDGRWLMASVREPQAVQPASRGPLASLDWLVGSWRAEQNGGSMDVTFRWVANHTFLERVYSVEQGGRITASGVQLIGQDPTSRELQSWNFTSNAGYAVGDWIPRPHGWAIATRGKLPNGTTTSAVNYLTQVDEDTLSWQSRDRKSGDVSLPDTDTVQLKRVGDDR